MAKRCGWLLWPDLPEKWPTQRSECSPAGREEGRLDIMSAVSSGQLASVVTGQAGEKRTGIVTGYLGW